MKEARAYSHDGPIGCRKRRYILTMDQSDAGSAGIFSATHTPPAGAPCVRYNFNRSALLMTVYARGNDNLPYIEAVCVLSDEKG
eukprot:218830-Prorocentrum_minimum.AAC.6